jgi:hypothetical protein
MISPDGAVVAAARRTDEGETPPPAMLVAEIDIAAGLRRADSESSPLWEGLRPELHSP